MAVNYCSALLGCCLLLNAAYCNPVVSISSSVGNFNIELFDDSAPLSVRNFLNYVESGRYNRTIIHRSVPAFVIQGGGLSFQSQNNTLIQIELDAPILNEFRLSNIRGTVSMAKVSGDPNSATSQWFINLADNSTSLDVQNGGFTVFGRIVGKGMEVIDEIASLNTYTVGGLTNFPLVNYGQSPLSDENFVTILSSEIQAAQVGPNYFDLERSELRLTLAAEDSGMATLALRFETSESLAGFKLVLNSIQWLDSPVQNMATFNSADRSIHIPELFLDGKKAYKNLKLYLEDAQQFTFVLDSYEKL